MQNFTKYLEDQRPRLRPSEHKELVKISGDRTLEIEVTKTGSIETRIIGLELLLFLPGLKKADSKHA